MRFITFKQCNTTGCDHRSCEGCLFQNTSHEICSECVQKNDFNTVCYHTMRKGTPLQTESVEKIIFLLALRVRKEEEAIYRLDQENIIAPSDYRSQLKRIRQASLSAYQSLLDEFKNLLEIEND